MISKFLRLSEMKLMLFKETFGVCRFELSQTLPHWALENKETLLSITYTDEELSIVCPLSSIPEIIECEKPWNSIKIINPLDFGLTGILSSLSVPLAENGISIFAISTYDTDCILIKEIDKNRKEI
jgi:hypothetical protein